jgi:hypothetical protein
MRARDEAQEWYLDAVETGRSSATALPRPGKRELDAVAAGE